jgi:NADH pyrophosphatase NudC (nudix superfamily)
MGTKSTYKCNSCGYQAMVSGGTDKGMHAVTGTYICESCMEIVDVCIGEYGQEFTREEAQIRKNKSGTSLDFYVCPGCGSDKNLVRWSARNRPCPKCGGKMEKDLDGGLVMLWD